MMRLQKPAGLAFLCGIAGTGLFGQCPAGNPPVVVTVTSATTSQATTCLQGPPSGSLTINGGSTVVWQAGTTVYLLPGFTAVAGGSSTAFIASIGPMVTTTALPSGAIGTAYSATLTAAEGASNGPFTWTVTGLPSPLSYNASTGQISGTPTGAGQFPITVTATDSSLRSSLPQPLTLTTGSGLAITTNSLPAGTPGSPYPSTTLQASGGELPYQSWQVINGALPSGLTLASNGTISGTPTTSQTATFTVQVTDHSNATASKQLSISVGAVELTIVPPPPGDGRVSTGYSAQVSAIGGSGAYNWTVTAGSLPTGLGLSAGTGIISGTPSATGLSTFAIQVADGAGHHASESFSLQINAAGGSTVTSREYIRMGGSVIAIEAAAGAAETVSTPSTPNGNTNPTVETTATYSTGGSVASTGNAVQYQFNWGDGTAPSGWSSTASAAHTWSSIGNWQVTAQARDSATGVQSSLSNPPLSVTVGDVVPVLISLSPINQSGNGAVFTAVVQDYSGVSSFHNASFELDYWFHSAGGDCHFRYRPGANLIDLDQGISYTWPQSGTPQVAGSSLSYGVCFINYGASQATINGTTLTVSVALSIYQVAGTYTLNLSATNSAGTSAGGWTPFGSWTVAPWANLYICKSQGSYTCYPPTTEVFGDSSASSNSNLWALLLETNLPNTLFEFCWNNGYGCQANYATTDAQGNWGVPDPGTSGALYPALDGSWQEWVVFPSVTSNTVYFTVGP